MPIVTIQITKEPGRSGTDTVTAEEKAALIGGVTKLLQDILNKPPESTFVVITEVEKENWGWGGLPIDEFRAVRAGAQTNDTARSDKPGD